VVQRMMVKDISTAEHYRCGAAVIEIGGRRHEVRERQGIEVAPGVPHQLRNESDADVLFLVVSAPKSHGDRVDV
jgi:mannose-6-phosphate isomerase-like protein (cupin superfamily)